MILFYWIPNLIPWSDIRWYILRAVYFPSLQVSQGREEKKGRIILTPISWYLYHRMGNISTASQPSEAWMTRYDEKREYVRYDLDTPIVYAFQDSDQFNPARLCNYCKGGMCFESDNAVEPGADIYIMMENFLPDSIDAEFSDGYLAEVRWCRKHSLEPAQQFLIGVKYYQTIIK